jgi:hypothetical protein
LLGADKTVPNELELTNGAGFDRLAWWGSGLSECVTSGRQEIDWVSGHGLNDSEHVRRARNYGMGRAYVVLDLDRKAPGLKTCAGLATESHAIAARSVTMI